MDVSSAGGGSRGGGAARGRRWLAVAASAPPAPAPCPRVEAFRRIVAAVHRLPSSDDYFSAARRPGWDGFLRSVSRDIDRIDGMLEVFRLLPPDPAADPAAAREIAALHRSTLGDRLREPYGRLLRDLDAAVQPYTAGHD